MGGRGNVGEQERARILLVRTASNESLCVTGEALEVRLKQTKANKR
jgi:hypothetical protein